MKATPEDVAKPSSGGPQSHWQDRSLNEGHARRRGEDPKQRSWAEATPPCLNEGHARRRGEVRWRHVHGRRPRRASMKATPEDVAKLADIVTMAS